MPDPVVVAPTPGVTATAPAPAVPKPAASAPTPAAVPAPAKPAVSATPAPQAGAPAQQVPLASLMEEREKRQALQAELENLKSTVQQIQQRQPAQIPGVQPVQVQPNVKEEMDKLWQTDPRAAVDRTVMMAVQWQDNVNAQVDGEAAQLASKYQDFNSYRDTAMRYVRALPLDQRARPGIVEMAYLVTRGQNVDQIIEQQRQQMTQRFITNPAEFQMPSGSAPAPTGGNAPQATDAEARAAKAMNIPIDQYLKWKK